jgi:hypothetical protein
MQCPIISAHLSTKLFKGAERNSSQRKRHRTHRKCQESQDERAGPLHFSQRWVLYLVLSTCRAAPAQRDFKPCGPQLGFQTKEWVEIALTEEGTLAGSLGMASSSRPTTPGTT